VRLVRGACAILLLGWALAPEVARYRAERILHTTQATLRFIAAHPREVADPLAALATVESLAELAGRALPGDPRPWVLAGGAQLVSGRPARAVESYLHGNALGERAEIDLNLGRAYETLGDGLRSHAAFLRAVWISPVLLSSLLPDAAASLLPDLERLNQELKSGALRSPPPLPEPPSSRAR
jgi:tetratricopeptide (TPR) repeat protein